MPAIQSASPTETHFRSKGKRGERRLTVANKRQVSRDGPMNPMPPSSGGVKLKSEAQEELLRQQIRRATITSHTKKLSDLTVMSVDNQLKPSCQTPSSYKPSPKDPSAQARENTRPFVSRNDSHLAQEAAAQLWHSHLAGVAGEDEVVDGETHTVHKEDPGEEGWLAMHLDKRTGAVTVSELKVGKPSVCFNDQ